MARHGLINGARGEAERATSVPCRLLAFGSYAGLCYKHRKLLLARPLPCFLKKTRTRTRRTFKRRINGRWAAGKETSSSFPRGNAFVVGALGRTRKRKLAALKRGACATGKEKRD